MSDGSAFQQQGGTVSFTANTAAPTPVQALGVGTPAGNVQTYILTNIGTLVSYVGLGATPAAATANAVIPVGGNSPFCYPLPAGFQVTIKGPPNAYFTGINAGTASLIHVTPGEGL